MTTYSHWCNTILAGHFLNQDAWHLSVLPNEILCARIEGMLTFIQNKRIQQKPFPKLVQVIG